ncbi:hypothetical protein K445DRAFT_14965 [Daldinia sp. EC12]|nr:hypothetical protein K445DRAFT_14965 [Daldinia sp. EC12]
MFKASFLLGLTVTLVTAVPQYTPDMMGYVYYCPTVDTVVEALGDPWQAGASGAGGTEIQITKGHTVGTTWTVGIGLDLSVGNIIDASGLLSGSVSETVEDTMEEAITVECPEGDWHCGVMVYPGVKRATGHMKRMGPDDSCPAGGTKSNYDGVKDGDLFELMIPRLDEAGNGFFEPTICTCKNPEHWADEGHPEEFCREDCTLTSS